MHWRFCIEDACCIFRFIQLESKDSLGETRLHIQSTKTVQKKEKKKEKGIKYTRTKPLWAQTASYGLLSLNPTVATSYLLFW